jgi:hypothetical protein
MGTKAIIALVVVFLLFLAVVYYINEEHFFTYYPPHYPDISGDWQTAPDYAVYKIWQFDNMAMLQRMPDSVIYTLAFTSGTGGVITSVQNNMAQAPAEPSTPIKFLTDGKVLQLRFSDKTYDFMRLSSDGKKRE